MRLFEDHEFTRQELIDLWLDQYPEDIGKEVEPYALGGYVELKSGKFLSFTLYMARIESERGENESRN